MIRINERLCKDCGYCIKFCPKHVLEKSGERNRRGFFYPVPTAPENCISCGICALMCPEGAIELPPKEE